MGTTTLMTAAAILWYQRSNSQKKIKALKMKHFQSRQSPRNWCEQSKVNPTA